MGAHIRLLHKRVVSGRLFLVSVFTPMTKGTRISLALTVALSLIALLPLIAFGIGYILNDFWMCDIRDEGGTVHGTCSEDESSIVYSLLIAPWFLMMTIPLAGIPALVTLIITLILGIRDLIRRRRA